MNPNQFFQMHFGNGFPPFGPQQNTNSEPQIPEYIIHNELVLEISNNWNFVKDVVRTYAEGKLTNSSDMERTWIGFIIKRNIDIGAYNEIEFLKAFWRKPEN